MKANAIETRQISVGVDPKEILRNIAYYLHIPMPHSLTDADIYWEVEYENQIPVRLCCYLKNETEEEELVNLLTRDSHQSIIERFAAVDELAKFLHKHV